jgi:hypothetical protein
MRVAVSTIRIKQGGAALVSLHGQSGTCGEAVVTFIYLSGSNEMSVTVPRSITFRPQGKEEWGPLCNCEAQELITAVLIFSLQRQRICVTKLLH